MKIITKTSLFAAAALMLASAANAGVVNSKWNENNVVIPSSQWTPAETYQALVWVVNTGQRYEGAQDNSNPNYNKVWGTPASDGSGNAWYELDYTPTASEGIEWTTQTSPFSSDERYKEQPSYRWCEVDIMGDIYMRRSFTINGDIEYPLYLATGHDDGPSEWYINGKLVYSIPEAWNNDDRVLLTAEQKALIKTDGSENILAVHVHQNWGGAFADCGLYFCDEQTYHHDFLYDKNNSGTGNWDCTYFFPDGIPGDTEWTKYDYDELTNGWGEGAGPFSNGNDQFLYTNWDSNAKPILIRRYFDVTAEDLANVANYNAFVKCSYDEFPRVYLNGVEICNWEGWNDDRYDVYELTAEEKALIVEGENVMAVSLQSGGGGGHIDFGFYLEGPYVDPSADITPMQEKLAESIATAKEVFPNNEYYQGLIADAEEVLATSTNGAELISTREALDAVIKDVKGFSNILVFYDETKALMGGINTEYPDELYANAKNRGDFENALKELRYARRIACFPVNNQEFKGSAFAAGEFYIYNVGRKMFLCGGSDWGAHAALGNPGVLMELVGSEEDIAANKAQIDTRLFNGPENHFLNYRGYCDCRIGAGEGVFLFDPVPGKENVYWIKQADYPDVHMQWNPNASCDDDGRNSKDETTVGTECRDLDPENLDAQWMLITKAERDELMNKASLEVPADVTYYILSPNFNQRENANDVWGRENSVVFGYGERKSNFVGESWNSEYFNFGQTIEAELPAGIYCVSVQGYYRNAGGGDQPNLPQLQLAYLYATDDVEIYTDLPNICSESGMAPGEGATLRATDGTEYKIPDSCDQATNFFRYGIYKTNLVFEFAGGEALPIGVGKDGRENENDWAVFDNFRLTYYGADTTVEAVENALSGVEAPIVDTPAFEDTRVFNLQGIQIANPTQPGIYIKGGKKFMVR